MDKSDIGGLDIYLKDIDDIDKEYPKIEELIGYKTMQKSNRNVSAD